MVDEVFCAYCGRVGTRGFALRYGSGDAPQTGDWCCADRRACLLRQASAGPRVSVWEASASVSEEATEL